MKAKVLIPSLFLALGVLAGCGNTGNSSSNGGNGGNNDGIPTIKFSENQFKNKTGREMMDIGFDNWCKKVSDVGICYEFNGQYTEAYARQLYPTFFDCYLFADGSVFGTYKANYVESEHDPNGRLYRCDGDGHADNESWFGYWYNKTDAGEDVLNIQWLGYGDYYDNHLCSYSGTSDAIISGDDYSAAVSLAINGNSRTCFIYGKKYSPYKADTLKVEKNSKAPTTQSAANPVLNYGYTVTCERENGTKTEFGQYLFNWWFDAQGNISCEYPLLQLKKENCQTVTVTPVVYNTKIDYAGEMVDCKITRDNSETALLEVNGKKARISYDEAFYRTVFDITGYAEDAANTLTAAEFANIGTKYYYIGRGNEYDSTDKDGNPTRTKEVVSEPEGTHLVPELNHYDCVESTTPYTADKTEGKNVNGICSDMDKVFIQPTKGPTGVHTDSAQLIWYRDYDNKDSNNNPIDLISLRVSVSTNGCYISYHGLVTGYDEATHELTLASVGKWGNNIGGGTFTKAILNDTDNTFTVSTPISAYSRLWPAA